LSWSIIVALLLSTSKSNSYAMNSPVQSINSCLPSATNVPRSSLIITPENEVTPVIGGSLPLETISTQSQCTPFEEFAILSAQGIVDAGVFPCDVDETGMQNEETQIPVKIADTRESRLQQFLDDVGFSSIDQFGVATTVTLTDIAGNIRESSTIIGIPLLSFETVEGFFPNELDVRFFGIIKNQQSVSLNLEGTVDFIIDQDQLIATKKLFVSGTIRDANNIELFIVDTIPPPFADRPLKFNYQFDEETVVPTAPLLLQFPQGSLLPTPRGSVLVEIPELTAEIQAFEELIPQISSDIQGQFKFSIRQMEILLSELQGNPITSHTFRVIIRELLGTFVAEGRQEFIDWTGEFIAYELDFDVDKRRATIIDQDNEVVSVFKNDSRLLVCGTAERESVSRVTYPREQFCRKIIPALGILFDVRVFENIGGNITGKLIGEVLATDQIACQEITGLSRSDEYIIEVENLFFPISTPLSQHDYNVKFATAGGKAIFRSIDGGEFRSGTFKGWECIQRPSWEIASSNFGYSFDSRNP